MQVPFGVDAFGEKVFLGDVPHDPLIGIIAGMSGSGKTRAGNLIICQLVRYLGPCVQVVIIDPKAVGFIGFESRCHVYDRERDWFPLIDALSNEMQRRYRRMRDEGTPFFEISEDDPYLLLVIDEMSAVSNSTRLLKKEREEFMKKLLDYSFQCRQASMGLLILCQSCDSNTMPTSLRGNASTRIALRTAGAEQVTMIAGAKREDECPCDLLTLPGQFYAMTPATDGKWVKGRAWDMPPERARQVMRDFSGDKRLPYCLDWQNPAFAG